MKRKFAEGTELSVARTRAELDELLQKHGAKSVATLTSEKEAAVAFEMADRKIVFRLKLPARNERRFTHCRVNASQVEMLRAHAVAEKLWDAACRQKWRALLLAVKAKLVSVDEGIETFEEAFLAHIVLPGGRTVAEEVKSRIALAYTSGRDVPLLPAQGTAT